MKHSKARQIKWDLVDQLLCLVIEETGSPLFVEYTREDREYAIEQVKRIARTLNVTEHIYL
jgi:hypothetical protein